jgi:hypothetical protein
LNEAHATFADVKVGLTVEVKGATTVTGGFLATKVEIQAPAGAPAPVPEPAEVEFSGVIAGLTGSPASFTFTADGKTVHGNASTVIVGSGRGGSDAVPSDHGGSGGGDDGGNNGNDGGRQPITFANLANGLNVEVKGNTQTDGSVLATRIQLEDNDENEVEVTGAITAFVAGCPAVKFTVGTTRFTADATTTFTVACASLANGTVVEVKGGATLADGSVHVVSVKREDDN